VILAAGLLVLTGLGLFLAGVLTATTVYYWACVAVCALAAVLLVVARRRIARAEAATPAGGTTTTPKSAATAPPAPAVPAVPAGTVPADNVPAGHVPADAALADATAAEAVEARKPGTKPAAAPAPEPTSTGAHSFRATPSPVPATPENLADPPIEDVEVTDLLLIVDLKDQVLVVDEHPRYHLPGCRFLAGRTAVPLPMDEARVDGFTPCALCTPDRNLADRERARKHSRGA
jgi:hypothetical protein